MLHRLIWHFQRIAPTWLLFDSDWAQTEQAVPFLPHCSDVLPVGRVQWFKGSKCSNGKDNAAWYRFDARHSAGPVLHTWRGRGKQESRRIRCCAQCGQAFEVQRSTARFCSPACKQQAYRARLSVTANVTPPTVAPVPSDGVYEFRYVGHTDLLKFETEGWERLPALDQTHHAEYASLMRRRIQQDERPLIG